jgi:O-antigen/teichoic acid export membrane protein
MGKIVKRPSFLGCKDPARPQSSLNRSLPATQATLKSSVIRSAVEKQAQLDQRQVITNTAGNAAIVWVGDLVFAVLRYVTNIVMTNVFSQSIYGMYVTVYSAASLLGPIAALGLDITMLRFLSIYHAKGEKRLAAGLIRSIIWMTLISGLLCSALLYFSATFLAHMVYHQDTYALPLKEVALLIPLISLQLVLANGLQALRVIKATVLVNRLIQPALTLILIGVFYLLGLRLEALILATFCGYLTSIIAGQLLLGKASKQLVSHVTPKFESKAWLCFALPMSLNSLIANALDYTDVQFLAVFATTAQVGLYAAADRVSFIILMPAYALGFIFSPLIAQYYTSGEHEVLVNLSKLVMKWIFTVSWPLFLCFCIFHEAILGVFSKEYTAAGVVLMIVSFGNIIGIGSSVTGSLLLIMGKTRLILINSIAVVVINIGLSFWLVPHFNVIGAAVAIALTVFIFNVTAFLEVYWLLKIVILRWDMLKPVVAGGVASVAGFLLLHVIRVDYGYRAILGALSLIILFMLVYVLVLALLRFSKEDRIVLDAIRNKFAKKSSL